MSAKGGESVRRLGEYLVEAEALRSEQIGMLLDEQRENAAVGVHSRFGEIAVRKGWADADQVTRALKNQAQEEIDQHRRGPGAPGSRVDHRGRSSRRRAAAAPAPPRPLEEAIAELRLCTPEKLRVAGILATIRSATAMRRISGSSFSPYNVMELIVGEETSAAIRGDALCSCSQCWSNVFALALNAMPARYVSDHGRILDFYRRFREEYGALARERVKAALLPGAQQPQGLLLVALLRGDPLGQGGRRSGARGRRAGLRAPRAPAPGCTGAALRARARRSRSSRTSSSRGSSPRMRRSP